MCDGRAHIILVVSFIARGVSGMSSRDLVVTGKDPSKFKEPGNPVSMAFVLFPSDEPRLGGPSTPERDDTGKGMFLRRSGRWVESTHRPTVVVRLRLSGESRVMRIPRE